jgi:hypothetical protein
MRRTISFLVLAPLLAGCGGSGPKAPSPGTAGQANLVTAAYKYAACMRQHGIPDFPDPHVTTNGGQTEITQVAQASSSRTFQAAQKACAAIMPGPQNPNPAQTAQQRHQHMLGLLSFARCMRAHGVSGFPDPNAQGRISREMLASAGVDIHAPSVIRTAMTCIPASHGTVTRAAVANAVNGRG